ncbi:hypothetical protein CsatB_014037 [Cannabis sativa]
MIHEKVTYPSDNIIHFVAICHFSKITMDAVLDNVKGRAVWVRWSGMRPDWHRRFGGVEGFRLFRARIMEALALRQAVIQCRLLGFDKVPFE